MGLQQDLTHWVVSELIRLCREGNHGPVKRRIHYSVTKSPCPHSVVGGTAGEPLGCQALITWWQGPVTLGEDGTAAALG